MQDVKQCLNASRDVRLYSEGANRTTNIKTVQIDQVNTFE